MEEQQTQKPIEEGDKEQEEHQLTQLEAAKLIIDVNDNASTPESPSNHLGTPVSNPQSPLEQASSLPPSSSLTTSDQNGDVPQSEHSTATSSPIPATTTQQQQGGDPASTAPSVDDVRPLSLLPPIPIPRERPTSYSAPSSPRRGNVQLGGRNSFYSSDPISLETMRRAHSSGQAGQPDLQSMAQEELLAEIDGPAKANDPYTWERPLETVNRHSRVYDTAPPLSANNDRRMSRLPASISQYDPFGYGLSADKSPYDSALKYATVGGRSQTSSQGGFGTNSLPSSSRLSQSTSQQGTFIGSPHPSSSSMSAMSSGASNGYLSATSSTGTTPNGSPSSHWNDLPPVAIDMSKRRSSSFGDLGTHMRQSLAPLQTQPNGLKSPRPGTTGITRSKLSGEIDMLAPSPERATPATPIPIPTDQDFLNSKLYQRHLKAQKALEKERAKGKVPKKQQLQPYEQDLQKSAAARRTSVASDNGSILGKLKNRRSLGWFRSASEVALPTSVIESSPPIPSSQSVSQLPHYPPAATPTLSQSSSMPAPAFRNNRQSQFPPAPTVVVSHESPPNSRIAPSATSPNLPRSSTFSGGSPSKPSRALPPDPLSTSAIRLVSNPSTGPPTPNTASSGGSVVGGDHVQARTSRERQRTRTSSEGSNKSGQRPSSRSSATRAAQIATASSIPLPPSPQPEEGAWGAQQPQQYAGQAQSQSSAVPGRPDSTRDASDSTTASAVTAPSTVSPRPSGDGFQRSTSSSPVKAKTTGHRASSNVGGSERNGVPTSQSQQSGLSQRSMNGGIPPSNSSTPLHAAFAQGSAAAQTAAQVQQNQQPYQFAPQSYSTATNSQPASAYPPYGANGNGSAPLPPGLANSPSMHQNDFASPPTSNGGLNYYYQSRYSSEQSPASSESTVEPKTPPRTSAGPTLPPGAAPPISPYGEPGLRKRKSSLTLLFGAFSNGGSGKEDDREQRAKEANTQDLKASVLSKASTTSPTKPKSKEGGGGGLFGRSKKSSNTSAPRSPVGAAPTGAAPQTQPQSPSQPQMNGHAQLSSSTASSSTKLSKSGGGRSFFSFGRSSNKATPASGRSATPSTTSSYVDLADGSNKALPPTPPVPSQVMVNGR
ncbi:hypothetical protein T439DRAFT_329592 [Meredithblackwellia eburnea MCA 4105]